VKVLASASPTGDSTSLPSKFDFLRRKPSNGNPEHLASATPFLNGDSKHCPDKALLSDNDVYIKVERMVCLSDRSDFKARRNYCAAQVVEFNLDFVAVLRSNGQTIAKKVVRRAELLKGHPHGFRFQACS